MNNHMQKSSIPHSALPIPHSNPFRDAVLRHEIDPRRIAKFFGPFGDSLQAAGIVIPDHEQANGNYHDIVATILSDPDLLPESIRNGLITLGNAAAAENESRLDDAIKRRIPNVGINRACPIDCALELWFLAPDELQQFAWEGDVPPSPTSASPSSSSSSPAPLTDPPTLSLTPPPISASQHFRISAFDGVAQDAASFSRLARLSPAEYDRARRAEAKRLRLRIETLDTEVAKYRNELDLQAQANAVQLPAIELWPEPVNGAEVLDEVASRYSLYLVLPPGASDAFTLWTTHAHAFAAFHLSPRLSIYSPKPGCGKTTAFDVLTTMLPRPLRTENISPAVLFRLVDQLQPTLLLDEVDAYLPQSEELRGLLNAGHKRGACAYRCEGEGKTVRAFHAFAPAALAGIGSLPATLRDRSVLVPLMPAQEGQIAARFDPLRTDIEKTLARKLARWAHDNFEALAACNPPLPPGAFNRLADNWRPLLAVAQIAGGDWPARALAAFHSLGGTTSTSSEIKTDSHQFTLLENIRQIFTQTGRTRISSQELVASLRSLPPHLLTDSLTHSLSPSSLARHLSHLGVRPRNVKVGDRCLRGYQLADFTDGQE